MKTWPPQENNWPALHMFGLFPHLPNHTIHFFLALNFTLLALASYGSAPVHPLFLPLKI